MSVNPRVEYLYMANKVSEEELRRLNETVNVIKGSLDTLFEKFGRMGVVGAEASNRASEGLSSVHASINTSTASVRHLVEGLGGVATTLSQMAGTAIESFNNVSASIDASTRSLGKYEEIAKRVADAHKQQRQLEKEGDYLSRISKDFNKEYLDQNPYNSKETNQRAKGRAIGGAIRDLYEDPENELKKLPGALTTTVVSAFNPVAGQIAGSLVNIGMDFWQHRDREAAAGRTSALTFQQTSNLGYEDVNVYGKDIEQHKRFLEQQNLAKNEEVEAVYRNFAAGGAKAQDVFSRSNNATGFGDNIAGASLGLDKSLGMAAGSSAKLAQELRQNMNVGLDESIKLLGQLGNTAQATSMTSEQFIGTVLQTTSALRGQGADVKDTAANFLELQKAMGGNTPQATILAQTALNDQTNTVKNIENNPGALSEIAGRLGFTGTRDEQLRQLQDELNPALSTHKIPDLPHRIIGEAYEFAKETTDKVKYDSETKRRQALFLFAKQRLGMTELEIGSLYKADKAGDLDAHGMPAVHTQTPAEALQELKAFNARNNIAEMAKRAATIPLKVKAGFWETLPGMGNSPDTSNASSLSGTSFIDSLLGRPPPSPVHAPLPPLPPPTLPHVNTSTQASNAQTHTQEYAEFNVSVHQPAPIIQITRNTKSSKKVKEGYTIG
jgi:ABC-type transporter Mla subunit MlaD